MREIGHYFGGKLVSGTSGKFGDVFNPAAGELTARVALASAEEVNKVVATAAVVWPAWAATPPPRRARVMFRLKELLERDREELSAIVTEEHGKVQSDADGEVQRGLVVVEFACGNGQPSSADRSASRRQTGSTRAGSVASGAHDSISRRA